MVFATLLALGSAVVHASWNLLIKTGGDRSLAAWGQFMSAAALAGVGLCIVGPPGWEVAPHLIGTGLVHVVYIEALAAAYSHGDFSMSYPLARGAGAVLAAVGSVVVLTDTLSTPAWVAITVASVGLLSLRVGAGVAVADDVMLGADLDADVALESEPASSGGSVLSGSEDRALVYALVTGVCIAVYSLIDSAGSRRAPSGVSYGLAATASAGVFISLANVVRPSRRARAGRLLVQWRRNLLGGLGTVVAYTMVLVAVRHAPVGYVTMLRESSVVFGALVGWLVLGERMGGRRLVSSVVILGGLVMLVAVS